MRAQFHMNRTRERIVDNVAKFRILVNQSFYNRKLFMLLTKHQRYVNLLHNIYVDLLRLHKSRGFGNCVSTGEGTKLPLL